jgi:hypothetical protein
MFRRFFFILLTIFLVGASQAYFVFAAAGDGELLPSSYLPASITDVSVERALKIKIEVESANRKDLKTLADALQTELERLERIQASAPGVHTLNKVLHDDLVKRLQDDKKIYQTIKDELDKKSGPERGSFALRTSLVKLIGTDKFSGILDDAILLLNDESDGYDPFMDDPVKLDPQNNRITVLKTLLIYANVVVRKAKNLSETGAVCTDLQLMYPAKIPVGLDQQCLQQVCLVGVSHLGEGSAVEYQLLVPNAGFVYGGDFFNGVCHGVDCSALISYCDRLVDEQGKSQRLSTMVMEYTWRQLKNGELAFNDDEKKTRDEFMQDWGMSVGLKAYQALDPKMNQLKQGDLIVWRWNVEGGKRDGHVVKFLEPVADDVESFIGIESNRLDDKSIEGIVVRKFKLHREKADTYVLRRKI